MMREIHVIFLVPSCPTAPMRHIIPLKIELQDPDALRWLRHTPAETSMRVEKSRGKKHRDAALLRT